MENNYYIKKDYKSREIAETLDDENRKYWVDRRISQALYFRYSIFKNCRKLIKKKNLKSVLDIGCGPSIKLMKLIYPVCKDVYGIDQENIVNFNRKKYGLNIFFYDDIENPSLNLKRKFDLIISSDVIEHLLNPDKLLDYIKKYSNKDTYIIITTPERDIRRGENCNFSPIKSHVREWNKKEFHKYIKNSGFNIILHEIVENYKFSYLLKNSLDISKKYNNLKKIRFNQLVICNLNNSSYPPDPTIYKIFGKNPLRDSLNVLYLKFRRIILYLYKINKKYLHIKTRLKSLL